MRGSTTTTLLIVLILGGIAWAEFGDRIVPPAVDGGLEASEGCAGETCDGGPTAPPVLDAATACRDVGYLCFPLEEEPEYRIFRFPDDTDVIRIRVPLPDFEDADVARRLQQAAVQGISRWDDSPFPLTIDTHSRAMRPADITVRWARQLGGAQLGFTRSQQGVMNGTIVHNVTEFALATRSPYRIDQLLEPDQLMLTAAHEMGHALGLRHSDDERDVMYETNTAQALTARDYRTLEALYRIPNGAIIRP